MTIKHKVNAVTPRLSDEDPDPLEQDETDNSNTQQLDGWLPWDADDRHQPAALRSFTAIAEEQIALAGGAELARGNMLRLHARFGERRTIVVDDRCIQGLRKMAPDLHHPVAQPELIPTFDALDRFLVETLRAPHDLPAFPRSTVDG